MKLTSTIWYDTNSEPPKNYIWYKDGKHWAYNDETKSWEETVIDEGVYTRIDGLEERITALEELIPENVPKTIIANGTYFEDAGGQEFLSVGPIYEELIENAKRGGISLVKYTEPSFDYEAVAQVITSITAGGSLWAYVIDVDQSATPGVMAIVKVVEEQA